MTDTPNTANMAPGLTAPSAGGSAGVLERFAEWLPITDSTPRISLGEGSTPLVRAASLERRTGAAEVWLKLEMCNPTASFKDRGMVLAVAKALEEGATAVLCASTGNTSASAAAYAARCGLKAFVLVPGAQNRAGQTRPGDRPRRPRPRHRRQLRRCAPPRPRSHR